MLKPSSSVDISPFSIGIKKNLKSLAIDKNVSSVQSHAWPNIFSDNSMIIIESVLHNDRIEEGISTLAYLPAILNSLETHRGVPQAMGPIAIVVAKSSAAVKAIAKLSLDISPGVNIVQAFGVSDKLVDLMNGCDLLVTTPPAFVRLSQGTSLDIFDKQRIKHLIFDAVDAMLEAFDSEMHSIIKTCTYGPMRAPSNPQIIVTASRYVREIKGKFEPLMEPKKRVICINDYIEAAAFFKCEFELMPTTNEEDKLVKFLKLFEDRSYKNQRTVVATTDEISMESLARRLKLAGVENSISADSWMLQKKGSFHVLLINDKNLKSLNLTCAEHLIHFSLPKNWRLFTHRFSLLLDQMHLHYDKKEDSTAPHTKIFLVDDNIVEFTKLISFMRSRQLMKITDRDYSLITKVSSVFCIFIRTFINSSY